MFFSDIIQAQNKLYHWISKSLMIICLKDISEKCFSLNASVNANIKLLWVLRGHLDTRKALRHLGIYGTSGTWALRGLRHLGTQGARARGHLRYFIQQTFWNRIYREYQEKKRMKFTGDSSKENENNDHFEEIYLSKKIPRFTPVVTKYSVGKYFLVLVPILKFGDVCLAFIFHKNNLPPNSSLSLRVNFHQVKIVKHQYQVKDTMNNFFDKAITCPALRLWAGKCISFEFTHVLF